MTELHVTDVRRIEKSLEKQRQAIVLLDVAKGILYTAWTWEYLIEAKGCKAADDLTDVIDHLDDARTELGFHIAGMELVLRKLSKGA